MIVRVYPVIDYGVRELCHKPYPLHPRGCPNYNNRKRCPPKAPYFDQVYDLSKPVYAVVNEFDIGVHIAKMKLKHPTWSDRQLRCVLYWQGSARKQLKAQIRKELVALPGYMVTMTPEGMGVNVTKTMAEVGIILEWPPVHTARQIAFMAERKK
jgi:predicted metal-binding protein